MKYLIKNDNHDPLMIFRGLRGDPLESAMDFLSGIGLRCYRGDPFVWVKLQGVMEPLIIEKYEDDNSFIGIDPIYIFEGLVDGPAQKA